MNKDQIVETLDLWIFWEKDLGTGHIREAHLEWNSKCRGF